MKWPRVGQRLRDRIEKLKGSALSGLDLQFVGDNLPLSELERLKVFSAVDSATLNRDGVARMQDLVAEILSGLGFKVEMIKGEARFAPLIIAERAGRESKFITLVTHSDTVLGNKQPFVVDLEQARASGSGRDRQQGWTYRRARRA